jgi:hypothetical protein
MFHYAEREIYFLKYVLNDADLTDLEHARCSSSE